MLTRRNWSIRTRSILLLLATLLPLPILGGYWVFTATQAEHRRLEHEAHELAALVAAQVHGRLDVVHEMLGVLARLPAVQSQDRREADRLFRALLADSPHLDHISLAEADGTVVASTFPLPRGERISLADRNWFQEALRSGRPAVSPWSSSPILSGTARGVSSPR
jgi:hypothetical protein